MKKGFATDEIVSLGLQVKFNFAYFLRLLLLFEVEAMRKEKYHIYLCDEELKRVIGCLLIVEFT